MTAVIVKRHDEAISCKISEHVYIYGIASYLATTGSTTFIAEEPVMMRK